MLTSPPPHKDAISPSATGRPDDGSSDLKFISDLGRSLLFTVHPKKVAARVADAIRTALGAQICVFVAELETIGLISCAFGNKGEIDSDFFNRSAFEKWLTFMPPHIAYSEQEKSEFLIASVGHTIEYVSPLHINGEIKGAIISGI